MTIKRKLNLVLFFVVTNYILFIYVLSNFNHVLGVVSQTRVSDENRSNDPHANSLAYYPLDYKRTQLNQIIF